MSKTIVVAGFGPGISRAVAERFGKEGFNVALVARGAERLDAAVKELEARGIRAAAFPTDLSDPQAARALGGRVRERLGAVTVLQWNAYANAAGDLLTADMAELRSVFDVPVVSLVQAIQGVLSDMKAQKDAAVLVTNGGFGVLDPAVDAAAAASNAMGLALANAAKHKLIRLLSAKLGPEGIHVGEVMILGLVKGTAWDNGTATIDAATVAARFWEHYSARKQLSVNVT